MTRYRSATLALAACAASLAVAACSSGTPSASSSATASVSPAATGTGTGTGTAAPVTSAPPPTSGAPIASRTLQVKGKLGSFPVPAAAKIGENMSGGSSLVLVFGLVAPADVSRFYATALPKAGFTVTSNSLVSQNGQNGALIQFNGHGYRGNIEAIDQFPESIAGLGNTNVTTVTISPMS
jgi:hypothetical protein